MYIYVYIYIYVYVCVCVFVCVCACVCVYVCVCVYQYLSCDRPSAPCIGVSRTKSPAKKRLGKSVRCAGRFRKDPGEKIVAHSGARMTMLSATCVCVCVCVCV